MMFSNALYLFSYKKGLFTPKTVSEILDLSSKTDPRSLRLFRKRKTCYIAELNKTDDLHICTNYGKAISHLITE